MRAPYPSCVTSTTVTQKPVSAARVAELAGDALPDPADLPDSAFELVAAARDLDAAIVMTDVDAAVRAQAAADLADIAQRLRAAPCSWAVTRTAGSRASRRRAPVA
jgi:hypothetical protein